MISLKSIALRIVTSIRDSGIKTRSKFLKSFDEPKKQIRAARRKNKTAEPITATKRIELSPLEFALMTQAPIHVSSFDKALISASKIRFDNYPISEKNNIGIIVRGSTFPLPTGLIKTSELITRNRPQL
jgi:hypothetical protein